MKKWIIILLLTGNVFYLFAKNEPIGLICNLLAHPELTVITTPVPQFGWVIPPEKANERQVAYRILVASSLSKLNENVGDMWDSGKQISTRSQHIQYEGTNLQPFSEYYWKVAFWNAKDEESDFSQPQKFNTGEFHRKSLWPGESRWVKIQKEDNELWTFEDRTPICYHTKYPRKTLQKTNGTWFVDFGRSAFAYATFNLYWPEADTTLRKTIRIRIGEKAINDSIDRKPGGGVLCEEFPLEIRPGKHDYTLNIPRFVSKYPHSQTMPEHMHEIIPFRYCEIESEDQSIILVSTIQFALHTVFDDNASSFSSSSKMLNDIYDFCKYSIKANTFNGDYAASQRERMMYEADSYIHQMGHYAVDREFSVARYSLKNMIFHATWPTEWISHAIMMAWADYLHTGNKDVISEFYEELKPKTLLALTEANGLISTRTGLQNKEFLASIHFNGEKLNDIVDWPNKSLSGNLKGGESDEFEFCDYNTVVNAFHYHSLILMSEMAAATGRKQDAYYFTKQAKRVKKAFNTYFFDSSKGYYVDGIGTSHASLHSNMFALAFDLVPESRKVSVIAYIKTKGMACGVYGANYLLEALFDAGEADYALDLLTSTTDRSWYNMIRVGSTMTTEAWDNKYKTNNGWSHAWSSSPAHIIPRKLVGIEPLSPGYETFRIMPAITSLKTFSMRLPTVRGEVISEFVNNGNAIKLNVTIPGNTTAKVYLPLLGKVSQILSNGNTIKKYKTEMKYIVIDNVASGEHQFEVRFIQ